MRSPLAAASILFLVACGPNDGRGTGTHHGDGGTTSGSDGGTTHGGNTFDAMCGGQKTTITGAVVAPNAVDPVANAFVYVPISTGQFPDGVSCELCGMPIDGAETEAISGPDGRFTLDLGALTPTTQVQFTVNKGRFRRTMTLSGIVACQENPIGSPYTQLPGKANPGTDDIPKIAVALGAKDQLDVVLAAMGMDEQAGFDCYENRVNIPSTNKLTTPCGKRLSSGALPDLSAMLKDMNQLSSYNMLFISCSRGKWAALPAADQTTILQNLQAWTQAGGRLFATDNSYDYVAQSFPNDITWAGGTAIDAANVGVGNTSSPVTYTGRVNDSTLQAWLTAVSALTSGSNTLQLSGYLDQWSAIATLPMSTADMVDATDAKLYSSPSTPGPAQLVPQSVRFDVTPPGAMNACGRVIYTSYHTLSPTGSIDAQMLSPQERILEYLTFEAGACVGPIS